MVQLPPATSVTILPETVQIPVVVEAKLTANPEDTVALTAKGAVPNTWFASAPKTLVCSPVTVTVKACGGEVRPDPVSIAVMLNVKGLPAAELIMPLIA